MSEKQITDTEIQQVTLDVPIFERDERGLVKGVEYKFKSNGLVDWRAMINPAHIVLNKIRIQEDIKKEIFTKKIEEVTTSNVEDKYLLILLAGFKELAALRGFQSVVPKVDYASDSKCVVTTVIDWIPNFEAPNGYTVYGDVASATVQNVSRGYDLYLESIAANRSFVRAVRNFLGIHIVGNDEVKFGETNIAQESGETASYSPSRVATGNDSVGGNSSVSSMPSLQNILQKAAEAYVKKDGSKGITFDELKEACKTKFKAKVSGDPEEWKTWDDVSKVDSMTLTGILRKKAAKEATATETT